MGSSTSKSIETPKFEEKEPPLTQNPSPTNETQTQTDPNPPLETETLENQNPDVSSDQTKVSSNGEEGKGEGEEEEEGECGFCLFMKGGGCKDEFVAWEKCMEESEKNKEDVVEKCFEVTASLKNCMDAHPDYYAPILNAQNAAEAQVMKEMEKQSELKNQAVEEQEAKEVEIEIELKEKKAEEEQVVKELEKQSESKDRTAEEQGVKEAEREIEVVKDKEGKEEEEEEEECGFCLFMKGGGCKDSFIAWEKCMEESEKNKEDVVEKCFEVTALLKECMDAHSDYYEPVLKAEKAAEAQVVKELEKQNELKDKAAEVQVVKETEKQTELKDTAAEVERETELKDKIADEETKN